MHGYKYAQINKQTGESLHDLINKSNSKKTIINYNDKDIIDFPFCGL